VTDEKNVFTQNAIHQAVASEQGDPAVMENPARSERYRSLPGTLRGVLFTVTVFLSAFLLFQIQPLISRAILPWFGGAPGVWTTCMLVFQLLLCGGYLYSHLLTQRFPAALQVTCHVLLLILTAVFLQVLPSLEWKPTAASPPVLRITLLLLSTAGLPYFVLSTTGPLLIRWFSFIQPDIRPDRLYAISNAGSLLALVSYPVLFEPFLRLTVQADCWSAAFRVFAALGIGCAIVVWRFRQLSNSTGTRVQTTKALRPGPFSISQAMKWFVLAMMASTVLLAETNEVCQDVAVIPFLWVVPLSLYLLTFILCFESDRWYRRDVFALSTASLVLAVCWLQSFGSRTFLPIQLSLYFGAVFSICMLCHGELARLRPRPEQLTGYFLAISAGGAGGGLFVGILSPAVFPGFWEHDLSLLAACLLAIGVYSDERGWTRDDSRPSAIWLATAILLLVSVGTVSLARITGFRQAIAMHRNFYGVLEVESDPQEDAFVLRHGRILHGLQLNGNPRLPTMYYGYRTGVGRAIEVLREDRPSLRMGLVGLGVGTLAAYGKPEDAFRFYELNEDVTRLAKEYFSFLADCPSEVDIVHGDARLVLEAEPPQKFDLLVLDAFSGDAIPTHLLTAEAFAGFRKHLVRDGIIAVHISNIHFDLERVTAALADHYSLASVTLETDPVTDPVTGAASISEPGSRWVLMSESPTILEHSKFDAIRTRNEVSANHRVLWTDDFSNLFQLLIW
jgi:hypothetical protein